MPKRTSFTHPITGDIYTNLPDGTVGIRSPSGQVGVFVGPDQWISGEVKYVDRKMFTWVVSMR